MVVTVVLVLVAGMQSVPPGCSKPEKGINYSGNDLAINGTTTGVAVASLEACCTLCNGLATASLPCRFFTFRATGKGGGACHPKFSDAGRRSSVGAVSGSSGSAGPPAPPPKPYAGDTPNIVFIIDESTDGRTYNPDPENKTAMFIPNIRKLQERGAYFDAFYANSPVCAPSRTSMISGRHVHRVPHTHNGVAVNGAWNNAEGNPPGYSLKWTDVLQQTTASPDPIDWDNRGELGEPTDPVAVERQLRDRAAEVAEVLVDAGGPAGRYAPRPAGPKTPPYAPSPTFGKTDWTVGGHAVWNWLQCWTMYVDFPFNTTDPAFRDPTQTGAGASWSEQPNKGDCRQQGNVAPYHPGPDPSPNSTRTHLGDWINVDKNTAWIEDVAPTLPTPWFVYHGIDIVHPSYTTNQYWLDKIDASKITVPAWAPLEELHPCDFQSSMLKGCIPPADEKAVFYAADRRRLIIQIYFAMIAEYDAMVGQYVDAVESSGFTGKTYFVLTSDHGDMRMQHQQFYKMVPWEASARVPLVVAGPGVTPGKVYHQPASLLDIYPTMLELTGNVLPAGHTGLDGYSLVPLFTEKTETVGLDTTRPDWVMSQGHMADNAMSWYLVRQNEMKLIVYGTGSEHPSKLYNLSSDPDENHDLGADPAFATIVQQMTTILKGTVDIAAVSLDVADYNKKMFTEWYAKQTGYKGTWKDWVIKGGGGEPNGLPGGGDGTAWPVGTVAPGLAAMEKWLSEPPALKPCRGALWTQ